MALEQLNRSIDFVADSPPSDANDGELFLDTSLSPPQVKVFDASSGSFVRPRTVQNLDAPVSNAGATQSDISSGVDASTTASTVANNLDAPVSNAGADIKFTGTFELSLAEFIIPFDVSKEDSTPQAVSFNGDGTTMFMVGNDTRSVYQYSLDAPFDISTAIFTGKSLDISGQDVNPRGLAFSGDGTAMFLMGDANQSVFQYSLNTPSDISTASFTGTSFDVSGQAGSPRGIDFNDTGDTMLIMGISTATVFQYNLASAFDISTASFTGKSFDARDQDADPYGVALSTDGSKMFVSGNDQKEVHQYRLSTAFDISTASFTGKSFDVNSEDGDPKGVAFSRDGSGMFLIGQTTESIYQYLLGTVAPK
jgi:sugar lactone lactonase YvrE